MSEAETQICRRCRSRVEAFLQQVGTLPQCGTRPPRFVSENQEVLRQRPQSPAARCGGYGPPSRSEHGWDRWRQMGQIRALRTNVPCTTWTCGKPDGEIPHLSHLCFPSVKSVFLSVTSVDVFILPPPAHSPAGAPRSSSPPPSHSRPAWPAQTGSPGPGPRCARSQGPS